MHGLLKATVGLGHPSAQYIYILKSLDLHINFILIVFNHMKTILHCLHLKAGLPSFPWYSLSGKSSSFTFNADAQAINFGSKL